MLRKIIKAGIDPFLLRLAKRMKVLVEMEGINNAGYVADINPTASLYADSQINNFLGDPKAIVVGAHTQIWGQLQVFWDGGNINIGEWCFVGNGARIWSQASISIGNHVLISHLVEVHDTNSHPVDWSERRLDSRELLSGTYRIPTQTISKPIVIEDDVWIGFRSIILKGVRIGRGAIVAAGSVVVDDVPALTVVAGNPARVVRTLSLDREVGNLSV